MSNILNILPPVAMKTNIYGLYYGLSGILFALHKINFNDSINNIVGKIKKFLKNHRFDPQEIPPGIMTGLSGISYVMSIVGEEEWAVETFRSTFNHPLLLKNFTYAYGISGWGIANLYYYSRYLENIYLDNALMAYSNLRKNYLKVRTRKKPGLFWGNSGITLFLSNLYQITKDGELSNLIDVLMQSEIQRFGKVDDDGMEILANGVMSSYIEDGSSGIILSLNHLPEPLFRKYKKYIYSIIKGLEKPTFFIGNSVLYGSAGIILSLLHIKKNIPEMEFLINKILSTLLSNLFIFSVEVENGIRMPVSEYVTKVSFDFGSGISGILYSLYALSQARKRGGETYRFLPLIWEIGR